MLVHHRVTPRINGTYLYFWVERGIVRVRCITLEHNTMFQGRTRARTSRSGDERTNHEATAPNKNKIKRRALKWNQRLDERPKNRYNRALNKPEKVLYACPAVLLRNIVLFGFYNKNVNSHLQCFLGVINFGVLFADASLSDQNNKTNKGEKWKKKLVRHSNNKCRP